MLSESVYKLLDEKKAENIVCLNVSKRSSLTDYVIIASGTSSRHVQSLAYYIIKELKKNVLHVEGLSSGEWVLLDLGDVILHLFKPEIRIFYDLEQLWKEQEAEPTITL